MRNKGNMKKSDSANSMKQDEIKRINDQLDNAQKLLEKMKVELAGFQSDVEAEEKALDTQFSKIEETEALKGRAGWLGMVGRKH